MMNAIMTQIGIDKSHVPELYEVCQCFSVLEDGALAHSLQEQEIEQFYGSNVQQNLAAQNDVRLARRLHDEEEEERFQLAHQLQRMEEQDCKYAMEIQEELHRCDEEAQRREKEDKEMAKQLQEEEETKIRQERAVAGYHEDTGDSLLSQGLGLWKQMMRDAELARRLQEEEEEEAQPHRRSTDTGEDVRTVQVVRDEEFARYMQQQEKSNRSHDLLAQEGSHVPGGTGRRVARERLDSAGLHSPAEEEDQPSLIPTCMALHTHTFHNIAEELDPTFTGRRRQTESRISSIPMSGICLAPRTPHSIFYDYLPEPSAVRSSRRHADKPARHKPKEKRESCNQQ